MPGWESFAEQFGPWIGLGVYVFVKDVLPFITSKWLPSKLKEVERKAKLQKDDDEWRKRMEEERLEELKGIATSTRALTLNMTQTNERIATMMSNQQTIIMKQDTHHNTMMEAISDMREVVALRQGEEKGKKQSKGEA